MTIRLCKTPSRLWWYVLWPSLLYIISSEISKDTDACLAVTGAICGNSKEKLTKNRVHSLLKIDVGSRSNVPFLKFQKTNYRVIYTAYLHKEFYHIQREIKKQILFLILSMGSAKILFFPSTATNMNNLDQEFISPSPNSIYNCQKS